nr:MBL fold metallo-hydrolase [Actinomycetota bacterium]NIU68599.1 MBL fold metallo-hydrolase [Actinomycetota bacterium]NIW30429.1 MBL fold metallo-hydrolase [Actinomycetota bacterium]NIX22389.1 MBL fold metallo-hydrolase [Actinomycetota bacterium]
LHEHAVSYEYPRVVERVTIGDRLDFGSPGVVPPGYAGLTRT